MNLSRISTRVILFDASFSADFLHRANAHSCHWRARARRNAIHAAIHARRIIAFVKYCPRIRLASSTIRNPVFVSVPSPLSPRLPHIFPPPPSSPGRLRRCWFLLLSTTQQPPTVAQRLLLDDYSPGRSRNRSDRSLKSCFRLYREQTEINTFVTHRDN